MHSYQATHPWLVQLAEKADTPVTVLLLQVFASNAGTQYFVASEGILRSGLGPLQLLLESCCRAGSLDIRVGLG